MHQFANTKLVYSLFLIPQCELTLSFSLLINPSYMYFLFQKTRRVKDTQLLSHMTAILSSNFANSKVYRSAEDRVDRQLDKIAVCGQDIDTL